MKTIFKRLFLLAIVLGTPNLVKAASACSYSEQAELNDIVANVKANYEVVDVYGGKALDIDNPDESGNIPEVEYYVKAFNISILNITEDIYVKVTNSKDSNEMTFKYQDTVNGIATFQTKEVEDLNTYTFEVYANKYSCAGEMFRKFTLTTPMHNRYSEMIACQNNPDFYYCQEFIPSENITLDEFSKKIKEYESETKVKEEEQKNQEKNFFEKLKDFYTNNKLMIYSIGVVIVVMGVATTVILVKKKRSRVL